MRLLVWWQFPRALGSREFSFPLGLTLYDDEFVLRTSEASMDESGVVVLEKGGTVTWTKPLR